MNEAIKHTPGPWAVGEVKHLIVGDSPRRVIASADMHPRYEVCEANARLIAAAPELLDVAKDFRQELSLCMAITGNMAEKVARLEAKVNAAIAKAEGKDQ